VLGGPGASVVVAKDCEGLGAAVRRELIREGSVTPGPADDRAARWRTGRGARRRRSRRGDVRSGAANPARMDPPLRRGV